MACCPIHSGGSTYAGQLDPAVTAFGRRAPLLDVQIPQLTTWGLDHADFVALCVVRLPPPLCGDVSANTLSLPPRGKSSPAQAFIARRPTYVSLLEGDIVRVFQWCGCRRNGACRSWCRCVVVVAGRCRFRGGLVRREVLACGNASQSQSRFNTYARMKFEDSSSLRHVVATANTPTSRRREHHHA